MHQILARVKPLRYVLAAILASGCAVVRDAPHARFTTSVSVFTALALFLCVLSLLEAVMSRAPQRLSASKRIRRIAAVSTAILPPYVFASWRWWKARDALPGWTPILFTALAVVGALALSAPRLWRQSSGLVGRARIAYSILLGGAWIVLHTSSGTLEAIRPGTEYLHLLLFSGTMLATWGLTIVLADRMPSPESALRATWHVRALVCVVLALAFLEIDRRALVDLYPAVHAWLGLLGLVLMDTASRLALSRAQSRALILGGSIATAGLTVLVGWLAATGGGAFAGIIGRADATRMPLGSTVLQLLPESRALFRRKPTSPLALRYPQYLEADAGRERFNVLLVTVDALRHDQVGHGDRKVPYAPSLQAFAETAVRFRNAYAQGPRTSLAMSSLLLGRYGGNMDWELWLYRNGRIAPLSPKALDGGGRFVFTTVPKFRTATLAQRLQGAGYFTVAVPFAGENEFFRTGVGFEKGFDVFRDLSAKKWRAPTSARVAEIALRQLALLRKEPWFLWVHFYDPHESRRDRNRYEELVQAFDTAFGKLLARIEPIAGRTAVVVLADHGEAFGEHRHTGHASSLFDEQTKIPLLVRIPGVKPRDENRVVAAIDVTATLAVLGGADTSDLDGVNLLPLMRERRYPSHRPVFTELHRYLSSRAKRTDDMTAVVLDGHKLIVDWKRGTASLFHLAGDPAEMKNLVADDPERFERLYDLVESYRQNAEYSHPLP